MGTVHAHSSFGIGAVAYVSEMQGYLYFQAEGAAEFAGGLPSMSYKLEWIFKQESYDGIPGTSVAFRKFAYLCRPVGLTVKKGVYVANWPQAPAQN